jgi:hypothetical protein
MPPDTAKVKKNPYNENDEVDMIATSSSTSRQPFNWRMVLGAALIISGILVLAEQGLHTGILPVFAPLVSGSVLLGAGLRDRQSGYLIGGSILFGLGSGLLASWMGFIGTAPLRRLGIGLLGVSLGFALITILVWLVIRKLVWWPMIPTGIIGSVAAVFLFTTAGLLDFVFYVSAGTGIVFLGVGAYKRLLGLIIPGCLVISIGPGVAFAWGKMPGISAMAQTGAMLVWFALGWALITLISRMVFQKLFWWPLIPGGILAVVGWGLYIGGNPGNAVSFIGNTGSIVMIIFGFYLLLMRRGIRR